MYSHRSRLIVDRNNNNSFANKALLLYGCSLCVRQATLSSPASTNVKSSPPANAQLSFVYFARWGLLHFVHEFND